MYKKYRKRKMNKNIPKATSVDDEEPVVSNYSTDILPEIETTADAASDGVVIVDNDVMENKVDTATTTISDNSDLKPVIKANGDDIKNNDPDMVIDLDQYSEEKRGGRKPRNADNPCINFDCETGVDLRKAPCFCLSYYHIKDKPNKTQMVCNDCYSAAMCYYDTRVAILQNRKFLADLEGPVRNECVEIVDSDEEDQNGTETDDTEEVCFGEDIETYISETLPNLITNMYTKYQMDQQLTYGCDKVDNMVAKIGDDSADIESVHKDLQGAVDRIRKELYSNFQTEIQELPPLEIVDVATSPVQAKFTSPSSSTVVSPGGAKKLSPGGPIFKSAVSPPSSTMPVINTRRVREAERRSHRNITKPASYCEPSDEIEPVAPPVVETDIQVVSATSDSIASNLPPRGPLQRPRPVVGEPYYAMRQSVFGAWGKVRLLEILQPTEPSGNSSIVFKVRFDGKAKGQSLTKVIDGKQLAYAQPCPVRLDVGTRVIAVFKDETSLKRESFFTGVVAEPLCQANSFRYLVFFDDGYAQYVHHDKVLVVVECSRYVWDDIHPDSRLFIRKYLEKYPERPMVKLQQGQVVKTEWNGKWWIARVVRVEGSLVQMYFDADARSEWIYRGSARLGPLFLEMQAAANRQEKGPHIPKIQNARKNLPYVEYTRNGDIASKSGAVPVTPVIPSPAITVTLVPALPQIPSRAVARKSTNRPANTLPTPSYAPLPYSNNSNMVPFLPTHVQQPQSKVVYYTPKTIIAPKPYVPHVCSLECRNHVTLLLSQLKGYNPLSKPLLCGWYRQLCKYKGKKVVRYRAPCARMLRNMTELHQYLRITGSEMSVDMFDFDFWVHCLAEFVLEKTFRHSKDISNGVEHVPIPCVNYVDNTMPDFCNYSTKREPMEGVNLNLEQEYLCGCNCEDDCADKTKCACWQLTIREARTLNKRVPDELIGYTYKRLPEFVTTGIYECNARCKCAATCLNRVVQHPLQLKLQLFKTANRGWGIRCLNDIPQGAFICIYAGSLLTDKMANEGGVNYGDEYLAELDYIEVVERQKDGYESDVTDVDDELKEEHEDDGDDENYVFEDPGIGCKDEDGEFVCAMSTSITESTIRTRSRKRTAESTSTSASSSVTGGDDSNSVSGSSAGVSNKIPRTEPQVKEKDIAQVKEKDIAQVKEKDIPQVTEKDIPQVKEKDIPQVKEKDMPQVKEKDMPQVKEKDMPQVKEKDMPQVKDKDMPQVKDKDMPQVKEELPQAMEKDMLQTTDKEPQKPSEDDTVTISDDDENVREPSRFDPSCETNMDESFVSKFKSVRKMFGEDEVCYIMDAKNTGNIGRFLNHSCSPNVFVQNVFVDTHDLRFPWVAFFAMNYIRAGTELTWNYNYDVGSVPNKVIFCHCGSPECRGRLL